MRAFSLVELSIVLVILGLLTGGILAGQSLIRAAELRSVASDYQRWVTATRSFQDKYLALPGDMAYATKFWGDNAAACADAAVADGTPGTCNGDGDGKLWGSVTAGTTGERFQYWNQLALAGLIEGGYTGLAGAGSSDACIPGSNIPAGKLSNSGWSTRYDGTTGGPAATFSLFYGNRFNFGSIVSAWDPSGAILTPAELWNLDTKLDDGKPARGKLIARYFEDCTDATSATDYDSDYKLSSNTIACAIQFVNQF